MQPKLIYDTIHGNIELSGLETSILKSSFTNRLHQILQNSTAYLVFPSCRTSRFEHSLGVMQYTSELFINGLKNSSSTLEYLKDKSKVLLELIDNDNRFFSDYFDENIPTESRSLVFPNYLLEKFGPDNSACSNFITDEDHCEKVNKELLNIIGDVFVDKIIGLNNSNFSSLEKFTFLILFQTIRLYGLLHDIGHLPFSHIFEFTIESVYDILSPQMSTNPTIEKIRAINNAEDKIHEVVGKSITRLILNEVERNICNDPNLSSEVKILRLFSIKCIDLCYIEIRKEKVYSQFASLSSIVNNTIDADRLDFVQRDGHVSGVSKSAGNVQRIIKLYYLKKDEKSINLDKYYFLPSIQSLHDVEKLLLDRYNIYRYMRIKG